MKNDQALASLRASHEEFGSIVPFEIVERCYKIQREYQFDNDQGTSLAMMRDTIGILVDKLLEESSEQEE